MTPRPPHGQSAATDPPASAAGESAQQVESAAAAWCARRDSDRWDVEDECALGRWMAASTARRLAYLRIAAGWQRADRLAALKRPRADAAIPGGGPVTRGVFARRRVPGSLPQRVAGVLTIAGLAGLLRVFVPAAATTLEYATPLGGREVVALDDGTRLTLNTSSRVRASVGAAGRTVWLDRGEVFFNVAHDSAHPFVVLVGDQRITVLGTRFSVRRQGDRAAVLVEEGRVRVERLGSATQAPASAVLIRDDAVEAGPAQLAVTRKTPEQVEGALSWRDGKIVLDHLTLDEAVAEFNRYNTIKLVVADSQAAHTPLGGTFDVENVRGFIELLRSGFGLQVRESERGQQLTISR